MFSRFIGLVGGETKLHFTLIDPEEQSLEVAARRARLCASYGSDAVMIGGSTIKGEDKGLVHDTIKVIKDSVDIPIIQFPNSAEVISENTDYIFFMSLLNSRINQYLLGEQVKGAPLIRRFGVKPISMAYILISTSEEATTVERIVGRENLDIIKEGDIDKAVNYALTAQYLNMECVYLEAGSNADKPVPDEMISAVRAEIDIPIIVGGGIRDGETAREKTEAGADVIVNGTATEEDCTLIREIIKGINPGN